MSSPVAISGVESGNWTVEGALTRANAPGFFRETMKLFDRDAGPNTVDLGKVIDIDSSGLALLLEWQSLKQETIQFTNVPDRLIRLTRLARATNDLVLEARPAGNP